MIRNWIASLAAFFLLTVSSAAFAADGHEVLAWGNFDHLGSTTTSVSVDYTTKGRVPVNDKWIYVYDPTFYFSLAGVIPPSDRFAELANYGFVVVAAAGDPGGNYLTQPPFFGVTSFTSSYDPAIPLLNMSLSYQATYVPTMRGFQSYFIYYNYKQVAPPTELVVYDSDRFFWPSDKSGLAFGSQNYLLTGDGEQTGATFSTWSPDAYLGPAAMEVHTQQDSGVGTHWKLMLFAHGNAASYDGIDLTGYDKLVFYAKASRPATLLGGFGTGDDSAQRGFAPIALTTAYQRVELDLSGLDLHDINTLLWVYLHKSVNSFDFSDVSVLVDNVKFIKTH